MELTEQQWKERLTPEAFQVLRLGQTEPGGRGAYLYHDQPGRYRCAGELNRQAWNQRTPSLS